jgi:hypothetical protein
MAGLPALEEKLTSPELQSFSQRLSARCYLATLSRAETAQYIRAQLAASQADADRLFASAALEAVFNATDGVPRLVNRLCDRARVLADGHRLEKIDAALVQAAWADLQQLPTAWEPPQQSTQPTSAPASVVEFGSLAAMPSVSSTATIHEEPTELDDEFIAPAATIVKSRPVAAPQSEVVPSSPSPRPAPPRRQRMASGRVPEAVDPFAESFEEEELVLDSFVTLASIFGTRTPRVENSREPAFSRLVQHALDATAATAARKTETIEAKSDRPIETAGDFTRPTLRLAVVSESPLRSDEGPATAAEWGFTRQPLAAKSSEANHADDAADAILVIEDEPPTTDDRPQSGVRRESYRQLFSRLRHGT